MKKFKNIFSVWGMLSLLLLFSSCTNLYVSKGYSGNQCFKIVDQFLQSQGWERNTESDKIVFIKGQSIKLTFDYDGEGPEVQVHLQKKDNDNFEVSVGNFGMIGEIHLMENRFERISAKLDEKIKEKCRM